MKSGKTFIFFKNILLQVLKKIAGYLRSGVWISQITGKISTGIGSIPLAAFFLRRPKYFLSLENAKKLFSEMGLVNLYSALIFCFVSGFIFTLFSQLSMTGVTRDPLTGVTTKDPVTGVTKSPVVVVVEPAKPITNNVVNNEDSYSLYRYLLPL